MVDIGCRGDLIAAYLFGAGVLGRQRTPAGAGHGEGGVSRECIRVEQLGDPEVQQFDFPVVGDQDVRRLDVAMDDQVGVGVLDGLGDIEEQPQPPLDGALIRVAILRDRLAVDVFHRQPGLAVRRRAAVYQPGDVGMVQG